MDGEDCYCLVSNHDWYLLSPPPIITSCYSITGYILSVVNNVSQRVSSYGIAVDEGTSLSPILVVHTTTSSYMLLLTVEQ